MYNFSGSDCDDSVEKDIIPSPDKAPGFEVNSDEEGAVSVSNRQYEERLQEQYSQIRLLDTRYLVPFIEEFDRLIKQEA